jgi:putative ABC transport system permease protein
LRLSWNPGARIAVSRARSNALSPWLADLRFAFRSIVRRPWLSAGTALTLAVGLAANATIFGLVDALIFRPLAFPEQQRLVQLWESSPSTDSFERSNTSPANFLDWRDQAEDVLETLVAVEWWDAAVAGRDLTERIQGSRVSQGFFEALGAAPRQGRGFAASEWQEGAGNVVVIGHDLWQRAFGADAATLGRVVTIDGQPHTVVGIAPQGFRFPVGTEVWAPLVLPAAGASRDAHYLTVLGKLAPGRTRAAARARMEIVAARLRAEHPDTNANRGVVLKSLSEGMEDAAVRPIFAVWQAAALVLLLLACLNVAHVLLARGTERHRELAVRVALGADRKRLVGQLATEALVLAATAGALSVPLAALGSRELRRYLPAHIVRFVPGWEGIGVDTRMLLFTAACALLAVALASLWPALRSTRVDLASGLKEGGRGATVGGRRQRGRNALVVAEVAGALALLTAAAICVRGAVGLLRGAQGFDPDRLLTLRVSLPESRYPDADAQRGFAREALARLQRLPGVRHATLANVLPASTNNTARSIEVEGEPSPDASNRPEADARSVAPGYFEALGIPILSGRGLIASDDAGAAPVAVVSRAMAERHWPGRDPIGRRFRAGDGPWLTIVGVSGDVIQQWFTRRWYPTFYQSFEQWPRSGLALALRTGGEPEALATAARQALRDVDPYLPAYDVWSMRRGMHYATLGVQYGAIVMAAFGLLALVLAVSGVYGVMAYRVSQRTSEFGLRVALGATRADILRLTLGQAARLTALGLLIGLGLALGLGRALATAFAGAVAPDAASFAAFAAVLAGAALLAAAVPARRAAAADPAQTLRAE